MDWLLKFWLTAFLLAAGAIDVAVLGNTVVSGTVFCDQCKDGEISIFDFPAQGIQVQIVCLSSDGEPQLWGEETSNWLGGYAITFDGAVDLRGCYVQVVPGGGGGLSDCTAAAGPPRSLRLVFDMFGFETYTADPLLSQPAQPMPSCPRSAAPFILPPVPDFPPPLLPIPHFPVSPPVFHLPPLPPVPNLPYFPPIPHFPVSPPLSELPPVPQLPNFPPFPPVIPISPPLPFLESSACTYKQWIMPEHRCYWKVVTPETKVAAAFGLIAGRNFGTNMTLIQGMEFSGDPYRTLLREGTTALLNSYDRIKFPYQPLEVIADMNSALIGSKLQVLRTALSFLRANSGETTHSSCRFTNCN